MTGHEARKGMKQKEERKCLKREMMKKGNEWRGPEPMKPDDLCLVKNARAVCAPKATTGPNEP